MMFGGVGRTLLSAAFDFDLDLEETGILHLRGRPSRSEDARAHIYWRGA